jgi:hypothetical protein
MRSLRRAEGDRRLKTSLMVDWPRSVIIIHLTMTWRRPKRAVATCVDGCETIEHQSAEHLCAKAVGKHDSLGAPGGAAGQHFKGPTSFTDCRNPRHGSTRSVSLVRHSRGLRVSIVADLGFRRRGCSPVGDVRALARQHESGDRPARKVKDIIPLELCTGSIVCSKFHNPIFGFSNVRSRNLFSSIQSPVLGL